MTKKNWITTTNRFVGFIDIMGFKDRLSRDHDGVYKLMKKVRNIIDRVQMWGDVHKKKYNSSSIKSFVFSDSIVFFTIDDSFECFTSISFLLSELTSLLIADEIPHKGSVAVGRITVDFKKQIFLGQPLVDAYLLQEELLLYGIVIHATVHEAAMKRLSQSPTEFPDNMLGVFYDCPFKTGIAKHILVSPWTVVVNDDKPYERTLASVNRLRYNTSGGLRKYIDNTEAFYKYLHTEHRKFQSSLDIYPN